MTRRVQRLRETWRSSGWLVTRADGSVARDRSGAPGGLSARSRRGEGIRPVAHVAPPSWEPRLLTRLAAWEPAAPRTQLGRALAYVWASPVTAAGLLVGILGGGRWSARDGVLLCTRVSGLPGTLMRRRGYAASALGHVVVATGAAPSPSLFAHELVHVRQAERLGPLMGPTYLALLAAYGYPRHPMERAARSAQRRIKPRG